MSETLHPERYVSGGIECADALDAMVSDWKDPVMAAHLWNAGKYIWRAPKKGDPVENLVKAANYILRDLHHLTMTGGRSDVYQQIQNALDDYLFNEEGAAANRSSGIAGSWEVDEEGTPICPICRMEARGFSDFCPNCGVMLEVSADD